MECNRCASSSTRSSSNCWPCSPTWARLIEPDPAPYAHTQCCAQIEGDVLAAYLSVHGGDLEAVVVAILDGSAGGPEGAQEAADREIAERIQAEDDAEAQRKKEEPMAKATA